MAVPIEFCPVVARLYPLFASGEPVRFWAEYGTVQWEDPKTKSSGSLSVAAASARVSALKQWCSQAGEEGDYPSERAKLHRFFDEMEEVLRMARIQGAPFAVNGPFSHPAPAAAAPASVPVSSRLVFPGGIV